MDDATRNQAAETTNDQGAAAQGAAAQAASQNVPRCPDGGGAIAPSAMQVPAGLSDAQQRAIWLLLTGTSFDRVAKEVGVDRRTVYRWRYESAPFRAELARARQRQWDHAADRLRGLVSAAFDVLSAEVVDEYDRSRVRAAGMILHLVNVRKLVEHELSARDE